MKDNKAPSESKDLRDYYSVIERVFTRWASFYDLVVSPIKSVRNRIVNLSGAKPGDKVLDVATGTGKQAFAFAKSGCDVIGIDITEGMLRVARKHNTYKNLSFRQADATSLPFQDNTFDITSIAFALHEMPSVVREKALLEMVRVTMPDGVIIISDYGLPGNRLWRFFVYHFVKAYEGNYYPEFAKSDITAFIRQAGISIQIIQAAACHIGVIIKGQKI